MFLPSTAIAIDALCVVGESDIFTFFKFPSSPSDDPAAVVEIIGDPIGADGDTFAVDCFSALSHIRRESCAAVILMTSPAVHLMA